MEQKVTNKKINAIIKWATYHKQIYSSAENNVMFTNLSKSSEDLDC